MALRNRTRDESSPVHVCVPSICTKRMPILQTSRDTRRVHVMWSQNYAIEVLPGMLLRMRGNRTARRISVRCSQLSISSTKKACRPACVRMTTSTRNSLTSRNPCNKAAYCNSLPVLFVVAVRHVLRCCDKRRSAPLCRERTKA